MANEKNGPPVAPGRADREVQQRDSHHIAARLPPPQPPACGHERSAIFALQTGAGGVQFRQYCFSCWADLQGCISHRRAAAELGDQVAPMLTIDQVYAARRLYAQRGQS